ncbi:MAG: metal-sensitive transcriptional regulator [Candidatus Andersenbacteria bacterium]
MKHGIKDKALRRLKILEGQVRGLQRMVEEEIYCIDILTQTSAAKEALSSIEDVILENHLSTHVIEQIKAGKNTPTKEIMTIYKLAKKR